MSRSPEKPVSLHSYALGWHSLSERIRKGKSFSGHERNTAFLNLGGENFADVSIASGLNFSDDTRAVVSCDWDFDGKVDFWTSNRNAPRVRFVKNESGGVHGFVAFKLKGTKVNRDAIGARVSISMAEKTQIKTVMAGDGFLAQSSRWQHFGVGEVKEVEVQVVWPGGMEEKFGAVKAGGFFQLTEGTGHAEEWIPPKVNLPAMKLPKEDRESYKRVLMVGRIPLLKVPGISPATGRVTLLRVWSKDCPACERQGLDLGRRQGQLEVDKVSLISVNIDDFMNRKQGERSDLLEAIEVFRDTFIESKRPLALPLQLLFDERGNVAAFYQGEIPYEVIQADAKGLSDDLKNQRTQAVPFSGLWAAQPFQRQFLRYAEGFKKAGMPKKKEAYLKQVREGGALMARVNRELGRDFLRTKNPLRARDHFLAALPFTRKNAQLHFNLGLAQTGLRDFEQAVNHFKASARVAPERPETYFRLAFALSAAGSGREAVRAYRRALELRPQWPAAANNLAWILAAHNDPSVRNGTEALRIAQVLMKNEGSENPTALLTLAAAYAEVGNFKSAIQVVDRALAIARADKMMEVGNQLRTIRADLAQGKPIRGKL